MTSSNTNPFRVGLDKNPANYVPLSPLTFIERAASVYPQRTAVVHGQVRRSWAETYERCRRIADALRKRGVGVGDTVAAMLPNIPEMLELHFAVPMAGAVLNALNVRLDSESIAFMLEHGEAKVLFTDREFSEVIDRALKRVGRRVLVVDVDDPLCETGDLLGRLDYEALAAEGDPAFEWVNPDDEWQAITLNYTSGTTGNPKGVVYHHRGAYLNAVSNIMVWNMGDHPVYLWTLPMFHCNGWCFPWTVTAMAGTHVCLRQVRADAVFDAIRRHNVSHFCAAPIVLNALLNAPEEQRRGIDHPVSAMTAGAAPPAAILGAMEGMGIGVTHVYGLTEVYGPVTVCAWHEEWDALPLQERARKKARQGVRYPMLEGLTVVDPATGEPVSRDGKTIGEIYMRGNNVMMGYLKNQRATDEAFNGGWFHTGDLAVCHGDGYVEIKDRSKDIIITGAENVSTIEVEDVLYRHPAVLEAAVVARPDKEWGEIPCAFVTLKPGREDVSEADVIAFCRDQIAHFKAPKTVVFGPLPKTSTGKIQKFVLREKARNL